MHKLNQTMMLQLESNSDANKRTKRDYLTLWDENMLHVIFTFKTMWWFDVVVKWDNFECWP